VENYVPGKLSEMGLGYEDIEKIAPHIIYCSITGISASQPHQCLCFQFLYFSCFSKKASGSVLLEVILLSFSSH
jgi:hypothetical protein